VAEKLVQQGYPVIFRWISHKNHGDSIEDAIKQMMEDLQSK